MSEIDRVVEALQRRVEALEDEAARLRQPVGQRSPAPCSGSRRQILLSGVGMLGALAGGAVLGRVEPTAAASSESSAATAVPARDLSLRTTLAPFKTRGILWAEHEWDFGAHFVGTEPPVVVATALDDYMPHDVAAYCVCAVAVHGTPGAYRATIMVRNISALATEVTINAVAYGV